MKLLRLNQGSPEWLAWRRDGLGGSDVAAVLGVSPFEDATPESVLEDKVHGRERERNFAMRRGTRLEPAARAAYERAFRCSAPPACVEHDDAPWMRVSLDGLCSNHALLPSERSFWVLELKVPCWQAHDLALAGLVPAYYRPQCQWQLLVTGLDRLDYVSFSENARFGPADRLAAVAVAPDPEEQARILGVCEAFWGRVLAARAAAAAATHGMARAGT